MTAVLTGAAEVVGGGLRIALMGTPGKISGYAGQLGSCAIIIGSGLVDLAAGIVWFIWAHR